ncbi:hypothetical protein [Carboxylicivirga marina]|uniref:hypothetical protein n=1 Tax=Carboxylicivirga marina TaxID=2800988 RepID=UPI0025917B7C|nr:hypothetical protein [uncultured Carboxylicivirga sp.]
MRLQKKMTHKQRQQSFLKGYLAQVRLHKYMLTFLFAMFAITATANYLETGSIASKNVAGGTTIAYTITMASIGNIEEGSARDAAGNQIGMRVWVIAREQVDDTQQFPLPNQDREVGTIPLKAGEYMHYHDSVSESAVSNGNGEKGDIGMDNTQKFGYVMYGNRKQLMNYIEEFAGKGFILIWQECGTNVRYIQGSLCKPMIFQTYDRKDDKEGRYVTFNYQNKHWAQPYIYTGDIIQQDPVTIAANANDLAYASNNGRYNLSDNAGATVLATVSGIAAADYGKQLTIYGSGGANPSTIADNTTFNLVDGETWTGNAGSSITFKILDANTLVEVSRVQTA